MQGPRSTVSVGKHLRTLSLALLVRNIKSKIGNCCEAPYEIAEKVVVQLQWHLIRVGNLIISFLLNPSFFVIERSIRLRKEQIAPVDLLP